jgi:alkaline phosphatase D
MLNRRAFLAGSLALLTTPRFIARARQDPRFDRFPFTLGVSSGDPSPDGIVLWTRLAPDPLTPNGGMTPEAVTVEWIVADDERMTKIVRRGTAVADSHFAHSVHVEVSGLRPDRWYWYQFRAAGAETAPARTRTLPEPGADIDRLGFAFVSCQHFEQGLFTAYRHVAAEPIDLVFHLGDYIYEGPNRNSGLTRSHIGLEPTTLEQYRTRYAQYKMDEDLQASHAACPWIATWDDHEVADNYAGAISRRNDPIDLFLQRRAAAYQAYYEHIPLRRTAIPQGPDARMYRHFAYGTLASFFVLDTRQYRTDQPCGDNLKPLCDGVFDPAATMMGPVQEEWFTRGLSRSRSRWNVIPQQVMVAPVDQAPGVERRLAMDQWGGYDAALTRLMKLFAGHTAKNAVVLSGDIHSNWVNDLKVDFLDPASPTVATELVGTSISSGGDGSDLPESMKPVLSENPFVRFHNDQRGYVVCDVGKRAMRADYRVMEYVSRPGSPVRTRAAFAIEAGRPGASSA